MTDFVRTPDENFDGLAGFSYEPNYHTWQDLRMHYVDEGPRDGPVALLLHGMPTWSYLYRDIIPTMTEAGYRCIAPDHMGFGRSDKPTDIHWYTIARHSEVLTSLITTLDLQNITLFCQDWGGPTGLAQAAMMPERFDHLVIMNTWLHHPEYEYSQGIVNWNRNWHEGGLFCRDQPDIGLLLLLSSGVATRDQVFPAIVEGRAPELTSPAAKQMYAAYSAPYRGLPDEGYNGMRRFPLSIPLDSYNNGNAAAQTLHFRTLLGWDKDVQFIWGCADDVFTESWGRQWAERMNAPFAALEGVGHFPQNTHGEEIARLVLEHRS